MNYQAESIRYSIEDKKYKDDTVFQKINRKYLTLDETHRRSNNEHLKLIVEQTFIPLMRQDELFNLLYKRIMYGGSYYKGTKYGVPNEFDLDFVLKLPIDYKKIQIDTNHDNYGFVKIKVDKTEPMPPNWEKHRKTLNSWLTDDNYLNQDRFNRWMQNIFEGAFRRLSDTGTLSSNYTITRNGRLYVATYTKSGPAFTVIVRTPGNSQIDIDLVPCLEFDNVELGNGYRRLNGNRTWMVVSKPLPAYVPNGAILWRLCFYEHEKDLLQGEVKPVIKMMKKFRDTRNWKSIASYYIETIFYHELEARRFDLNNYLRASNTWLFMTALRKLKEACREQRLAYYWHPNHNLFEKINSAELTKIANTLENIITRIDRTIEVDRYVLAKEVLTSDEYNDLEMGILVSDMGYLNVENNPVPAVAAEPASSCIIL